MKKASTVASEAEQEYFSAETDHRIGSGRSQQLVLRAGRGGPDPAGAASPHDGESVARSLRRDAAQPDRAGNRDAFALDQPFVERVGARSDRGQCAQGAADRGEPQERRSAGCADLGAAGPDRSGVAVSGEASQRAGASGSDDDPGTCRPGAGAHGAGQRGPRTGEVLRGTIARLQCAQHGSGESRRAESGTATGAGAVAVGHRRGERTHRASTTTGSRRWRKRVIRKWSC